MLEMKIKFDFIHSSLTVIITIYLILLSSNSAQSGVFDSSDDPWLNISQIISQRGFRPEIHRVTTEDGYILTMHRIVNPYIPLDELVKRKPVLMFSGGTSTTKGYVVHTKGKLGTDGVYREEDGKLMTNCNPTIDSASGSSESTTNTKTGAFVMSSCGYDVWLGDVRGTTDSLGHLEKSYFSFSYWHFSLQEVGWYDFPAMIEYILRINKSGSVNIITISQSSPALLFYLASRKSVPKPVNVAIMTAPAIFISQALDQIPILKPVSGTVRMLIIPIARMIESAIYYYGGPVPVRPKSVTATFGYAAQYINKLLESMGLENGVLRILNVIAPSATDVNPNQAAAFISTVDNTCALIISHFMQTYISGKFPYHNRGVSENRALYKQDTPPEVALEKITNKVAVFYGDEDFLAHPKDIAMLKSKMKVYYDYPIPMKGWKHGDYLCRMDIDRYILPHFLYLLKTVN